jgi:hypothetical protein
VLYNSDEETRKTAAEVYIKRAYRSYEFQEFSVDEWKGLMRASWSYIPPFGWYVIDSTV